MTSGSSWLPDRILHADILSDDDWAGDPPATPQDGATLVGRLDGYGPVADAILYHHEKLDRQRLSGRSDRQRDTARVAHPGNLLDLRHP